MITEATRDLVKEELRKAGGVMKTSLLYERCNLNFHDLNQLVKEEFLSRVKNGYYALKGKQISEVELLSSLFPDGILCMESALYYYGYINEKPFDWHIAVNKDTSKARFQLEYPVVVPYYTEERVLKVGLSSIVIDGITLKIYDRDRLICDVLKYESKLDHEKYKEAILSYLKDDKKNIEHLLQYSKERKVYTKVQNVIGVWL